MKKPICSLTFNAIASFLFLVCLVGCQESRDNVAGNNDAGNGDANDKPDNTETSKESSTNVDESKLFFEDVTKTSGMNFTHSIGPATHYHFPDIMVAGCGVIDFDRDGLLDLILIDSGDFDDVLKNNIEKRTRHSNRLFRQTKTGSFVDVTEDAGIDDRGYGSGVAVGDVNNDGWGDIFFTNYGNDSLWINQKNGKFKNVSDSCGISNPSWSSSASFFDFDRDGDLDLFVSNYVSYIAETNCADATGPPDYCSPRVFARTSDRLFETNTMQKKMK